MKFSRYNQHFVLGLKSLVLGPNPFKLLELSIVTHTDGNDRNPLRDINRLQPQLKYRPVVELPRTIGICVYPKLNVISDRKKNTFLLRKLIEGG